MVTKPAEQYEEPRPASSYTANDLAQTLPMVTNEQEEQIRRIQIATGMDDEAWATYYGNEHGLLGMFELARLDAKIEELKRIKDLFGGLYQTSTDESHDYDIDEEISKLEAQKAHLTTKGGDHE